MNSEDMKDKPFVIKDCALIAIATGKRAQNLKELRDQLLTVQPGSIYYHFWGGLLRPKFDDPEFNNDFAAWVAHRLHDRKLAERLAVIDPTDFANMEDLRQELVDVIEERLDESEYLVWARADQQFMYITSKIVVFDTNKRLYDPRELISSLETMSPSSVFYHFIDAKRRTDHNLDDFSSWLYGFEGKYDELCKQLAAIDPYFPTLTELREQLVKVFRLFFGEDTDDE